MILNILRVILIILEVVVLFNVLIIVHELGHFLAAKWRGLVVEKFGIWFGKPLWAKTIKGVEYSLGCIPAGGFVALPQMAPMETFEGEAKTERDEMPPISALDKIIVAFAGPLFSFMLAIVFAIIVWGVGRPVSESEQTTQIGYVQAGGPADLAGMKAGDKILEIDGKPVSRFGGMVDSVVWGIVGSEGETINFKIDRAGEIMEIEATPTKAEQNGFRRASLRQVSIAPRSTPVIAEVEPGSPADKASLQSNDIIFAVNGEELYWPNALVGVVEDNLGKDVTLTIKRGTETFDVQLSPEMMEAGKGAPARPRIGILFDQSGITQLAHPSPYEQIYLSVATIGKTLGALFSPKSDIKPQHMSGPVMIMRIYYMMFESPDGWRMALWFSVVLNVNLALLNLLPLPVLDGGHITLAVLESIRRKPVNIKVLEVVQTASALLLIGFMLYVTFYDVQDLPWFKGEKEVAAEVASPTPAPEPAAQSE